MNTKRFILMLLVMLGSVAGAWAQEPTKLHLTYVEDHDGGAIQEPENAFDGDLTTRTNVDFIDLDSSNPYITFKTDFPVRVDQLSIHYEDVFFYITGFELKGLKNEGDNWDTQSTSMLQKTNLGDPYRNWDNDRDFIHGPFNITCNPEDRYQYFRIMFNAASGPFISITEIELYVTCDHSYPAGTNVCSKCGHKDETVLHEHVYSSDWTYDKDGHWHVCSGTVGICNSPRGNYASHSSGLTCSVCGMPHCHQLDDAGSCRVDGCGYSVSSISQDLFEVLENYGGSSSSGFNNLGKLFDGNTDTKWQAGVKATAIFKTQTPVRIDGYSFHSVDGNYYGDWLHPHPKSWTLYGYDETASAWQIVHGVADASPSNGWNNYRFVNNDGPHYSYFKLEVTELKDDHPSCNTNIGGLTLDIIHEHNYADSWSSNDAYHWHECTSELGKCNNPRVQEGEHVYDNTATAGTVPYYTCSVCGYIDPVRQHVHHYMWIHDETKHWHECDGEGECNARTKDEAEHNIHESILCDTENYMCDVCQYVDEEKKAQFGADRDYLSMKAVGGDVRIGFKSQGTPDSYTIQVSEDGNHWSEPMELSATVSEVTTIPEGQTRYFRYGSTYAITSLNSSRRQVWRFTMDGEGTIEAGGNIMSLLDRTCQVTSAGDYAFSTLFYNCTNLTKAPKLPATTLGESCYYNMFGGCSSLQEVELPMVESFGTSCFSNWLDGTASDDNGKLIVPIVLIGNSTISLPNNWSMATRIKLNEDPDNSGNFYTTFYDSRYEYAVAEGHKAYTGSIEGDELHLAATPDNIIPKGDGVLIHGGSGEVLLTVSNTSADIIKENVLTGSNTDTTAPANCYILSYGQNRLGFYKYAAGKTLSAHKAYLVYEKPAGANALRMVFADEEVDGIENIKDNDSLRYDNDNIYSLSGVRLDKLQKGINIVNGKKIVVK